MIKLNSKKGLTLIGIIVSFAILAIIAVTFLPIFTAGIKGISFAGENSDTVFQSQEQAEDKITEGADSNAAQLSIVFPDTTPITVTIEGEDVTKGAIRVFIPK